MAWLAPTAMPVVRDWLQVRGEQPGPLLNPVLKGGRLQERALSALVYDLCMKLGPGSRHPGASPDDCRRTWIGELLEVSDLSTTQTDAEGLVVLLIITFTRTVDVELACMNVVRARGRLGEGWFDTATLLRP